MPSPYIGNDDYYPPSLMDNGDGTGAVEYRKNTVSGLSIKAIWVGTQAEYDAVAVKDASTEYNIVA